VELWRNFPNAEATGLGSSGGLISRRTPVPLGVNSNRPFSPAAVTPSSILKSTLRRQGKYSQRILRLALLWKLSGTGRRLSTNPNIFRLQRPRESRNYGKSERFCGAIELVLLAVTF
jgi:hypothetical protein